MAATGGRERRSAASARPFAPWLRLAEAIRLRHGRLRGDRAFLTALATDLVCNEHGSEMIGRMIEPHIARPRAHEGYRLLPPQERPVVMNVKGASASGKSTMRPLQRKLAEELGIHWTDFALISPDIWRKYLLDYDSLGEASKYAGPLTGLELRIIDQKLDRYMAQKAERGRMSHLLIDRFRFDSFAEEDGGGGQPPADPLRRGGLHVLHDHAAGSPRSSAPGSAGCRSGATRRSTISSTTTSRPTPGCRACSSPGRLRKDKQVHYEFLDNGVPEGERPRTVAFGWNGEMNILDVRCLLDVERFRKIDIAAKGPAEVHPDPAALAAENNTAFLLRCGRMIRKISLADHRTGRIYARIEAGAVAGIDPEALAVAMQDRDTRVALLALAPGICEARAWTEPRWLSSQEQAHTIGRWGSASPATTR